MKYAHFSLNNMGLEDIVEKGLKKGKYRIFVGENGEIEREFERNEKNEKNEAYGWNGFIDDDSGVCFKRHKFRSFVDEKGNRKDILKGDKRYKLKVIEVKGVEYCIEGNGWDPVKALVDTGALVSNVFNYFLRPVKSWDEKIDAGAEVRKDKEGEYKEFRNNKGEPLYVNYEDPDFKKDKIPQGGLEYYVVPKNTTLAKAAAGVRGAPLAIAGATAGALTALAAIPTFLYNLVDNKFGNSPRYVRWPGKFAALGLGAILTLGAIGAEETYVGLGQQATGRILAEVMQGNRRGPDWDRARVWRQIQAGVAKNPPQISFDPRPTRVDWCPDLEFLLHKPLPANRQLITMKCDPDTAERYPCSDDGRVIIHEYVSHAPMEDFPRRILLPFSWLEDNNHFNRNNRGINVKGKAKVIARYLFSLPGHLVKGKLPKLKSAGSGIEEQLQKLLMTEIGTMASRKGWRGKFRKLEEILCTTALDHFAREKWGSEAKHKLTVAYANRLPYASYTGLEAASQVYLGIPAKDMSLGQAIYMAMLLNEPGKHPHSKDGYEWQFNRYTTEILPRLVKRGLITAAQAKKWGTKEALGIIPKRRYDFSADSAIGVALEELKDKWYIDISPLMDEKYRDLPVPFELHLTARADVTEYVNAGLDKLKNPTAEIAAVIVSRGEIVAVRANRADDRSEYIHAYHEKKEANSTFKAFLAALGLEIGVISQHEKMINSCEDPKSRIPARLASGDYMRMFNDEGFDYSPREVYHLLDALAIFDRDVSFWSRVDDKGRVLVKEKPKYDPKNGKLVRTVAEPNMQAIKEYAAEQGKHGLEKLVSNLKDPKLRITGVKTRYSIQKYQALELAPEVVEPIPSRGKLGWCPRNHDNKYGGETNLRKILKESQNEPVVNLARRIHGGTMDVEGIGTEGIVRRAVQLGLDEDVVRENIRGGYGFALGSIGMTPIQLAAMYEAITTGEYREPTIIDSLTIAGREIIAPLAQREREVRKNLFPRHVIEKVREILGYVGTDLRKQVLNDKDIERRVRKLLVILEKTGTASDFAHAYLAFVLGLPGHPQYTGALLAIPGDDSPKKLVKRGGKGIEIKILGEGQYAGKVFGRVVVEMARAAALGPEKIGDFDIVADYQGLGGNCAGIVYENVVDVREYVKREVGEGLAQMIQTAERCGQLYSGKSDEAAFFKLVGAIGGIKQHETAALDEDDPDYYPRSRAIRTFEELTGYTIDPERDSEGRIGIVRLAQEYLDKSRIQENQN
jgi:membrane peptidoglycan carboxypeptidase